MAKTEFYSARVVSITILSCVCLMLAIWLSTVLRPTSVPRPNLADVVTLDNPVSLSPPSSSVKRPHQSRLNPLVASITSLTPEQRQQCYRTCRLYLVESLPENLTFSDRVSPPIGYTHESWTRLIRMAEKRIIMAAYKTSLRGRHVLDEEHWSSARLGDDVFDTLKSAVVERGVRLEAVENYPPKDRGDNEDASALSELGLMERRRLHIARVFRGGVMHSKFLLVDDSHFYLGSANFDWRSLNQKMELGVHVENCPCLANDLRTLYDAYWMAAVEDSDEIPDVSAFLDLPTLTSKSNPLTIQVGGADTEVHLAASPRQLNGVKRDWDLDAIVSVIDEARHQLDIHVMDYVPLFVYQKPRKFWPVIDDAIRRAVIERGVKVRFLTAALHFTSESLHALMSLRITAKAVRNGGEVDVKILNIPAITEAHRAFARERRTHRKFIVNDDALLIGTSNWSGDYFANTTGVAIVMRQRTAEKRTMGSEDGSQRPLINQARQIFERDWKSGYASDLDEYINKCYDHETRRDLCKVGRMAYQQTSTVRRT